MLVLRPDGEVVPVPGLELRERACHGQRECLDVPHLLPQGGGDGVGVGGALLVGVYLESGQRCVGLRRVRHVPGEHDAVLQLRYLELRLWRAQLPVGRVGLLGAGELREGSRVNRAGLLGGPLGRADDDSWSGVGLLLLGRGVDDTIGGRGGKVGRADAVGNDDGAVRLPSGSVVIVGKVYHLGIAATSCCCCWSRRNIVCSLSHL